MNESPLTKFVICRFIVPASGSYVTLSTLVSGFETVWEDPIIERRDRKRTITVMADPKILGDETAMAIFGRTKADIEAINYHQVIR